MWKMMLIKAISITDKQMCGEKLELFINFQMM